MTSDRCVSTVCPVCLSVCLSVTFVHSGGSRWNLALLWPKGSMDEDATWYGIRPRRRPHCIRRVPSTPRKGHSTTPSFRPMPIVATVAHLSYCWALVQTVAQKPIQTSTTDTDPSLAHAQWKTHFAKSYRQKCRCVLLSASMLRMYFSWNLDSSGTEADYCMV